MENTNNNPLYKRQGQDKHFTPQLITIFHYLEQHTAASMVADPTGIPQKIICRYKRDLEKARRLWKTEKKLCEQTGFKAWCLTTHPENGTFSNQLNLF